MKSALLLLVLAIVLSSLYTVRAVPFTKETPLTTAFDQYGNICWDDEKARLDNFAIQLQHFPGAVGYIFISAGRVSCQGESRFRGERAKKWMEKRGITSPRVIAIDAGYREDVGTVLWVVLPGVTAPPVESELKKSDVSIRRCVDRLFERVICLDRK